MSINIKSATVRKITMWTRTKWQRAWWPAIQKEYDNVEKEEGVGRESNASMKNEVFFVGNIVRKFAHLKT